MQKYVGDEYRVIEEGLSGRTTNIEHTKPGRNGESYLRPCLESQNPLDVVIIMLGTNDLKVPYNRSVQEVGMALEGIVSLVRDFGRNQANNPARVILVSPIHIDDTAPNFSMYVGKFDQLSAHKSLALATIIESVASSNACTFFDASEVALPGNDGVHMSVESHHKLGERLGELVQSVTRDSPV